MNDIATQHEPFRAEVAEWLEENFPKSLKGAGIAPFGGVEGEIPVQGDAADWRDRLASRGWGTLPRSALLRND